MYISLIYAQVLVVLLANVAAEFGKSSFMDRQNRMKLPTYLVFLLVEILAFRQALLRNSKSVFRDVIMQSVWFSIVNTSLALRDRTDYSKLQMPLISLRYDTSVHGNDALSFLALWNICSSFGIVLLWPNAYFMRWVIKSTSLPLYIDTDHFLCAFGSAY